MPHIDFTHLPGQDMRMPEPVMDSLSFADSAVKFAHLGLHAKGEGWGFPENHLYAVAIELAFKSLALRSGATLAECKKAGHNPEKMIKLIEGHGTKIPERLKTRLSCKVWFNAFFMMSRYPAISELNSSFETTIFVHPDYPEMIGEILSVNCSWPLSFEGGDALSEIRCPPKKSVYAKWTGKRPSGDIDDKTPI